MKRCIFTIALMLIWIQGIKAENEKVVQGADNTTPFTHKNVTISATPTQTILYGDVNRDGKLTLADLTAIANITLGHDNTIPYAYNHEAADLTGDGEVNIDDIVFMANILVGKAHAPTAGNTDEEPAVEPALAPKGNS